MPSTAAARQPRGARRGPRAGPVWVAAAAPGASRGALPTVLLWRFWRFGGFPRALAEAEGWWQGWWFATSLWQGWWSATPRWRSWFVFHGV